jgi:hypothetical protein
MEIIANGYKFVQNEEGYVEAFKTETGGESSPEPVFISNHVVNNQKEFEIEVSYLLNDNL